MQEQKELPLAAGMKRQQPFAVLRNRLFLMLVIVCGAMLLSPGTTISRPQHSLAAMPKVSKTVAINGADRWDRDSIVTAPTFDFSVPGPQTFNVSPLFEHYYRSHNGTTSLGTALTVAFPTEKGWMQFFAWGALLLPVAHQGRAYHIDTLLQELIDNGVSDSSSGITRLPLVQALLTVGGQISVGGDASSLTYVDLRQASSPSRMLAPPAVHSSVPASSGSQKVFVKGGIRDGKDVGHLVPQPIWDYIHRSDISPDGWENDFGAPLTEALAFTITKQGIAHRMLAQIFLHDGVVLDEDTLNNAGQPQVQRLTTGVAYLRTLGPPAIALKVQQSIWVQGETELLQLPGEGQTVAHVGQNFPLALVGDTSWKSGALWYHVQWGSQKHKSGGWVKASAITFNSPGHVPGWASFDALSPELGSYLTGLGDNVNAVVYDVTGQRYYTYHPDVQFNSGSSMKVPIMLTFLDMIEQENRGPDDTEMGLLTRMIENSDNDAASTLYFQTIGGADGVASYLNRIGITGLDPDPGAWGLSQISPMAMVNLLTDLYEGKILNPQDRNLAFYLMENIETDQQWGVGDTAPGGATTAMKNGWLPDPDGLWNVNSSGIVMVGKETYIVSVYTSGQNTQEDGQAILEHVCGSVASQLA